MITPDYTRETLSTYKKLCLIVIALLILLSNVNVMRREDILLKLKTEQDALKQLGVKSLYLFGSVARNEATPNSDVDFLVELERPAGFFNFFRKDLTFEAFQNQPAIVDAILYNFTVIGEAARAIPKAIQLRYPEIPWQDMLVISHWFTKEREQTTNNK